MRCRDCSLITMDPKPNDEELALLYADDYFETGQHGLNRTGQTYEESKDKLDKNLYKEAIQKNILAYKPDVKSIFEIGFAMGHMLSAARELGMEVGGIEFSQSAVDKAREKFGIRAVCGNFETIDLTSNAEKWDCIYGGDVYEHFTHPSEVSKNMYAMLKTGGVAIVVVPSTFNLWSTGFANLFFRLLGKRKKFYDNPYHLYEYTPKTIKALFRKYFSDVQVVNRIKKPSELNMKSGGAEYKMKYLIHLVNYPFTKLFNRNGDRLLVIARK
ncbi:MAG: class I SAM-dependent methyltransferase [Chitinophagales bacterium]